MWFPSVKWRPDICVLVLTMTGLSLLSLRSLAHGLKGSASEDLVKDVSGSSDGGWKTSREQMYMEDRHRRGVSEGENLDEREDQEIVENVGEVLSRTRRHSDRDPYVFNLFEVLLSTMESKLRRVESFDVALQALAKRMNAFEARLDNTLTATNKMIGLVERKLSTPSCPPHRADSLRNVKSSPRSQRHTHPPKTRPPRRSSLAFGKSIIYPVYFSSEASKHPVSAARSFTSSKHNLPSFPSNSFNLGMNQLGHTGIKSLGKSPRINIPSRIDLVAAHVSRIDSKLSNLEHQLDGNTLPGGTEEELQAEASESYRVNVGLGARRQALGKTPDLRGVELVLNRVHSSLEDMNQRLVRHTRVTENQLQDLSKHMGQLGGNLVEVRQATILQGPASSNSSAQRLDEPRSKLDILVEKISPLQEVQKKMDEVWSVLVGTKSSVDGLLPKSEALLSTSQRQERAILHIGTDLSLKTDKIIQNLGQMEQRLEAFPSNTKPSEQAGAPMNPSKFQKRPLKLHDLQSDLPGVKNTPEGSHNTTMHFDESSDVIKASPDGGLQTTGFADDINSTFPELSNAQTLLFQMLPNKQKPVYITPSVENHTTEYSCSDLMKRGETRTGNYYIRLKGTTYWYLRVRCNMDVAGGGWTVIQKRDDFGEPRENFDRDWADYKHGFGDLNREFYIGNENIHMLTNNQEHDLRVELEDFEGNKRYAEYSTFKLHSELNLYKLEIGGYQGTAGNSLDDPWYGSNLSPFSTYDRDNDRSSMNCARMLRGGWWWRSCGRGLNGLYISRPNTENGRKGIVWFRWRGWDYSLKRALIMIRPKTHSL